MDRNNQWLGHFVCFAAYAIFGFNIIICKDLTSGGVISPFGLFLLRSVFAGALFWLTSFFLPKEKVDRKDFPKIFAASFLGFFLTQITFLMGIPLITPMDCSIIVTTSPIFTMLIAAVVLKEPITVKKAGGVALSFAGILFLIFNSVASSNGVTETTPLGIILLIGNSLSFSLYLGIFKPLIAKYSPVTFMKWIFLFSTVLALPMGAKEVVAFDYAVQSSSFYWELGYLVFFATFMAYFLIPIGQKRIRPTLVSMYTYVQPIIATVISICIGMDQLNWQKILAASMVVAGVLLVTFSRSAADVPEKGRMLPPEK